MQIPSNCFGLEKAVIIGDVLYCPKCKGGHLHQTSTEAHYRRVEDGESYAVKTSGVKTETFVDKDGASNPSPRRDSSKIHFWCEQCDAKVSLAIIQHKGETYIGWTK
jgi:hypothetical protein